MRERPMHVLIVEDDTLLAMSLQALIEDLGATSTMVALTEASAIAYAHRYRPNLVVSDLHLADGLGADAVSAIRSTYGNTPVVYVTGDPEKARHLDPSALVLSKPLKDDELIAAIERLKPMMEEDL